MNLFLRLVLVWIKALFAPRIGVLEPFDTRFTVWPTDQDALRHVTNSRFFSMTDLCIIDFFLRSRVWRQLRAHKWFPLIVYEDMHFLKPLKYPNRFHVRSQILGWDDDRLLASHRFIRDRDGALIAAGYQVARFVDFKGKSVSTSLVAQAFNSPSSPALDQEAQAVLARSRAASESASSLAATASAGGETVAR